MLLYVPTVMHSGTHLAMNIVGYKEHWYGKPARHNNREIIQAHTDTPVGDTRIQEAQLVVSCLRHPRRVAESFIRRGKLRSDFLNQWCALQYDYSPYIHAYVGVDHPRRDVHAIRIQELIGLSPIFSWDVSSVSGSVHNTHDTPFDECPSVPQEFIDFYYQVLN